MINATNAQSPGILNPGVTFTGYNVSTTAWCPVVGLGVVIGTAFLSYIQTHGLVGYSFPNPPINYWVQIQAIGPLGPGPFSSVTGPLEVFP